MKKPIFEGACTAFITPMNEAGAGSNDTAYAKELTKYACSIGYDACLVVTPYYNKTTQR